MSTTGGDGSLHAPAGGDGSPHTPGGASRGKNGRTPVSALAASASFGSFSELLQQAETGSDDNNTQGKSKSSNSSESHGLQFQLEPGGLFEASTIAVVLGPTTTRTSTGFYIFPDGDFYLGQLDLYEQM